MIEFKVIKQGDYNKKLAVIDKLPNRIVPEGKKEIIRLVTNMRNAVLRSLKKTKTGDIYDWRGAYPGEKPDSYLEMFGGGKAWLVPIKFRSALHQASAPGEAPAIDTGEMQSRLFIDNRSDAVEFGSLSGVPPYPLWLEEGTENMEPRPWLEPVVKKFEPKIEDAIVNALNRSPAFGV